jgi:hypothetical protein
MPYRDWKVVKWFQTERELSLYLMKHHSEKFLYFVK